MKSKSNTYLIVLLVSLVFVTNSLAQENWKTKDFDKWDKQDVETILNKSDWVKNQEVRLQYSPSQTVAAGSFLPGVAGVAGDLSGNAAARSGANTVNQGSIAPSVDFTFTLRLRSSLAIRLALIRQAQLETNLEKLSKEERELFNKRQVGLYECPACADNYVLTFTSKSKENKNYDAVFAAFANARLDELKTYIYLQNERGEKRELVHFVPPKVPGDEAVFFFKRFDEKGNPLFTKESRYLVFNTTKNDVNTVTNFKIDIAPLVIGDRVDF